MSEPLAKKPKIKNTTTTTSNSNDPHSDTPTKISRAISACKNCRIRKVRCDQRHPKCTRCEQSGLECIGIDASTGREVPRSYVVHLEDKIRQLEAKLAQFTEGAGTGNVAGDTVAEIVTVAEQESKGTTLLERPTIVENGKNGVGKGGAGAGGDISFSKLMSTAVKVQRRNEKKNHLNEEALGEEPQVAATSDRDDVPESEQAAVLPPKSTALLFCQNFFHQCNPQFPIFHREEFIRDVFIPIYGPVPKEQFNFASNNGSINDSFWSDKVESDTSSSYWFNTYKQQFQQILATTKDPNADIKKISNSIVAPKRYHKALFFINMVFAVASSVHHLRYPSHISESFRLAAMNYYDAVKHGPDQLIALQGILLYAYYSIMRPTNPGIWYIVGEALRICVDLDLQNEMKTKSKQNFNIDSYTRDKRRRIFWCTYSIDRQICFYLDRPFGIPDESINTPLPSIADDSALKPTGFSSSSAGAGADEYPNRDEQKQQVASYKTVSLAFLNMRKIQSEVTKILYTGAEIPRKYVDLEHWKTDVLYRLSQWLENLPSPTQMNSDFNAIFFKLNYHHTLLYIHGLGPRNFNLSREDFLQVSISSKEVIDVYIQLLMTKSVNYTWAGVHNLFMAGTSYLYALYNSEAIRRDNPLDTVRYFTSSCLQVLSSLIDKCDAASYCCEIFRNLTMVILKMKYNNHEDIKNDTQSHQESKVSRESLYKINNGNVHFNLFSLVTELDHLNPLTSPTQTHQQQQQPNAKTNANTNANARGKPSVFEHLQNFNFPPAKQNPIPAPAPSQASAQPTAMETLSAAATSPIPKWENLDWNDDDLDYFFKELDHLSERSSPGANREGKMTFELMHNMPNEKIWDEFFTSK
ncbi:uncharacterized protein LODBEIA_P54950 [Lodderomyces beijingensis]|uniref:Zn(2)-C6 fungal-type domain-containing protein n=1 Tax=Lodderomyces beijingensis TaxID=1775926 RepID=A0ABP0ZVH1_9ASCO